MLYRAVFPKNVGKDCEIIYTATVESKIPCSQALKNLPNLYLLNMLQFHTVLGNYVRKIVGHSMGLNVVLYTKCLLMTRVFTSPELASGKYPYSVIQIYNALG